MFLKTCALAGCVLVFGLNGCTHNTGSIAGPTTTLSQDGLTRSQLEDKAHDLTQQGNDLLAKGHADNSADEQAEGQKLLDKADELMTQANNLAPAQ